MWDEMAEIRDDGTIMRTLSKILSSILALSLLLGAFFTPFPAKAGFLSSILENEASAEITESLNSTQGSKNSQNMALLQANVFSVVSARDKNSTNDTNTDTDNISGNALFPQNEKDTSSFYLGDTIVYIVENGDTLSEIAEKFNTSVNTIRWENNISGQKISVGQKLNIFSDFIGVKHIVKNGDTVGKIADKYDAIAEDISIFNDISDKDILKKDTIIFVPNGIIRPSVSKPTSSSGPSYVAFSNTKAPLGFYIRPAQGIITSPYGPRKGGFHYGVDIGNVRGTPIVAAIDGIVTKVVTGCVEGRRSCGGRYGNYIEINDLLGNKTRYSHLSKVFVIVGQSVSQGQQIGAMGNTGKSTGPHLDFSIENSNGSTMRPPI